MLIDAAAAAAAADDDPNDSDNAAGCFLLTFDNVNAQQKTADAVATTKINIMKKITRTQGHTKNFVIIVTIHIML